MSGIGMEDLQSGTPWWGGEGCGIGDSIEGLIVRAGREQMRDFDTGALMEWDNGEPRLESVVVIASDLRRDDIVDDTGERALHLRGGKPEIAKGSGSIGETALKNAMRESGLRVEPGMYCKAEITGMAKPTGRGRNPSKLWTITLSKPEPGIDESELFDE